MEVILLSATGLVALLLALFGVFCCVRRIFSASGRFRCGQLKPKGR